MQQVIIKINCIIKIKALMSSIVIIVEVKYPQADFDTLTQYLHPGLRANIFPGGPYFSSGSRLQLIQQTLPMK
jgi:hypothetical protein